MNKAVVAIVGPTGVGKSALAVELASRLGGEIVNADSRQVYRHMDIGISKPSAQERARVPHHLVDIIDPDEDFSQAEYQKLAYETIDQITARGKLPFLVGGTGLYVWSVLEGWRIPRVPPDPSLRKDLLARARAEGADAIYQELASADPEAAQKIDLKNVRRVIRALEIIRTTGVRFSALQRKEPPPFRSFILGLTTSRDNLYRRIDQRVDSMIQAGWLEEVRKLLHMGYSPSLPSMSSLGYRELAQHIQGESTLEEAVRQIKFKTHAFARRQYGWFRLSDPRIAWYDIENLDIVDIIKRIHDSLGIQTRA